MKRAALIACTAALLAAACGGEGKTTIALPSGGTLSGSWDSGCIATGSSRSARVEAAFGTSTLVLGEDQWRQNDTCAGEANYSSATTEGYGFTGTQELAGGGAATRVETMATGETHTPNDQATADDWNGKKLYGFSDWAPGVSKNTFGLGQNGASVEVPLVKDVFAINDSEQPNELYVGLSGDDGGELDSDGYPTSLDPNLVLLRE